MTSPMERAKTEKISSREYRKLRNLSLLVAALIIVTLLIIRKSDADNRKEEVRRAAEQQAALLAQLEYERCLSGNVTRGEIRNAFDLVTRKIDPAFADEVAANLQALSYRDCEEIKP